MSFSVTEELSLVAVDRKVQFHDRYAFICCPFHRDGLETHPSMIVNIDDSRFDPGFFYCFSCAEKGPWKKLAEILSLGVPDAVQQAQEGAKHLVKPLRLLNFRSDLAIPGVSWEAGRDWRGISGTVLADINSKATFNFKFKEEEIFLPVSILKKQVGGIHCSLTKKPKGYTSYRNEEGPWVKDALFPYDYVKSKITKDSVLCIVEGPRDALNLVQHGVLAVAILGCTNWSQNILPLLYICKPRKFIVLMDGDDAGRNAAIKIYTDLNRVNPGKVVRCDLPTGKDPGGLTAEEVEVLKQSLSSL